MNTGGLVKKKKMFFLLLTGETTLFAFWVAQQTLQKKNTLQYILHQTRKKYLKHPYLKILTIEVWLMPYIAYTQYYNK